MAWDGSAYRIGMNLHGMEKVSFQILAHDSWESRTFAWQSQPTHMTPVCWFCVGGGLVHSMGPNGVQEVHGFSVGWLWGPLLLMGVLE